MSWHNIVIALDQKLLCESALHSQFNADHMTNTLMTEHSHETEEHYYTLSVNMLVSVTWHTLRAFFDVSHQWHALFDLHDMSAAEIITNPHPWELTLASLISQQSVTHKWLALSSAPLLLSSGLSKTVWVEASLSFFKILQILHPGSTFHSLQKQALTLISQSTHDALIVLSTNDSKGDIILISTFLQHHSTTILVAPFIALCNQICDCAAAINMQCSFWSLILLACNTLILVTPEASIQPDFMTFLFNLHENKQLIHVILDECHIYTINLC